LTVFFGGFVCFLRSAFFARCVAVVFDSVFFFAFFLLEGMAAVYHWDLLGGSNVAEIRNSCRTLRGYFPPCDGSARCGESSAK
jgi:hypothetical protein